jgi:gas vesicle protein
VTTASDPEEIRREIERTQAALSQDVDALTEKVTPGKIVERRVDRARDAATRLKEKVMGSNDPYSSGHVGSAASNTLDRVSGTASSTASSVQGAASSAAGTVQDTASSAAGAVQDAASSAASAVQEAPQALRRQARGNPLAAGLIAFGAGWLVSSLLPASRREQELADQAKQVAQENLAPLAQQVAGEVKENLREPAQQAVESVKSTAQDAKDTVADEGRSAAQGVADRSKDAAGNVRSNAGSS